MVKTASDSSSPNLVEPKYKGVRLRKWGKFVSEIRLPNCRDRIWLGSYDSAEKAARAFDAALFCLRGPHAKFNFPENLPEIPDRQGLSPAQIQAVAQNYGNSYAGNNNNNTNNNNNDDDYDDDDEPEVGRAGGEVGLLDDMSPSSNREGAGQMDSIDWSFLDVLDSDHAGRVLDFGLFHEPGDMYMSSQFQDIGTDDWENDGEDGNGCYNVQSNFLWNF